MSVRVIGGELKGRKLASPRAGQLRPTSSLVRGAIFSILGAERISGARVLDLFAGTGALGIEALSRGAQWVEFVERGLKLCANIRSSVKQMAFDHRCQVHCAKAERAIASLMGGYDVVFMDPPYRQEGLDDILASLDEAGIVKAGGLVIVEHSKLTDLEDKYGTLRRTDTRRYGDTSLSIYRHSGDTDG